MVYNVVVSSEFFPQLKKAIALLGVLPAAQKMFERSSTPILDVCRMVLELPQKYSEMNMPMSEFGIIISILDDQSNLVYGDAYGVSFLLDPQYGGEVMDEEPILSTTPLAPTDETTTIIVIGATIAHGRNAVGDRGTVIVEDLYVAEEHCAEEDVYVVEDQYMAVELYVAEELCVVEQMYMAVELVCARRDGVVPDNSGSQDELLQHEWFTRPQSPTECRYADLLKFVIGDENFNAFEYVGDNGANAETMDIQFMDTV
ncbi:hypothetical protein L915_01299 [Phytophthora nicotianae]|uniref:Uncharacterized protein n=1 Tax=Phytophthora nicotianae TaxID=4792 RepID=W2JS32_PHYNI|nr:hypothetical protein L915_01299 [Phytophthora nicotianae]ETL49190.1 hypothetical protein L916_01281 [Phytophthora nicotianae]